MVETAASEDAGRVGEQECRPEFSSTGMRATWAGSSGDSEPGRPGAIRSGTYWC